MLDAKTFTYADPSDPFHRKLIIKAIEKMTGQIKLWRLYNEYQSEMLESDESFWDAALRKLDVTINYDRSQRENMPKTGPLVVVANHPYGVLDGLIISQLISRVRPDYKILTNSVLCKAEEVQNNVLEIDFAHTEEAIKTNIATRKKAREVLKEGGCITVFPAGGVSSIPNLKDMVAQDTAWQPFIGRLIIESKASVVPIFFEGQNSRMFQFASLCSPTLRTAMFFKEVADKIGTQIGLRIGDTIPFEAIEHIRDRDALVQELRRQTYLLGGIERNTPPKAAYRVDLAAKAAKGKKKKS